MNRSRTTVAAAAGTGLVVLTGVFAITSHDPSTAAPQEQSHPTVTDQPTVPSPDQLPPWADGHGGDRDGGGFPSDWPGSDAQPGTSATPATPGAAPSTSSQGS
ncbi:MAG: hypothetical protein JO291_10155 [Acidimicrobiia bacterium]|nr:hypothetical protein [Acidimicrobiia bacterium]